MDDGGRDTILDQWVGVGYGSVAVPGLHRDRVLEARGEWPILYYRAGMSCADIERAHRWAVRDLFRQRAAWLMVEWEPGELLQVLAD